jgi:hypothetical protein
MYDDCVDFEEEGDLDIWVSKHIVSQTGVNNRKCNDEPMVKAFQIAVVIKGGGRLNRCRKI